MFKFWSVPDNIPDRADVFVVLSYAVKDKRLPTKPTKAAIEKAYKYWKKFPKAKIILSTGDNQNLGVSNAWVMAKYAKKIGIKKGNIILEDRSQNTWENLTYSLKIIHELKANNPVVVFYYLHAKRALAIAKKLGMKEFCWLSAYSEGERAYGIRSIQTFSQFTILVYERLAILYCKVRGWS